MLGCVCSDITKSYIYPDIPIIRFLSIVSSQIRHFSAASFNPYKMLRSQIRRFSSTPSHLTNYGFVGLGQMGQHMARHIYNKLDPNDNLYVYDTVDKCSTAFYNDVTGKNPTNKGALKTLSSLSDFSDKNMDFIVTMVPEGKHVKSVVEELVKTHKGDKKPTFIDSSTIDIPTSIQVHDTVKSSGFDFIDAPVSGGVAGARKASLSFMLSRPTHESISPELTTLLKKMGSNIFPCGENHGTGLAAKLSNNYLLAITNLAVADSFQLAKSFGLDLQKYAKLVAVSTGKSWASVDNCPIKGVYPENELPADVDFAGGFVTKLTRKDLVLATESAKFNDRFLFLGDVGKYWYDEACKREDLANRDLGVLFEWLGEVKKGDHK